VDVKIKENKQFCRLQPKSSHLLTPIKDIHCCSINRYSQISSGSTASQPAKKLFCSFLSAVGLDWHSDYCRQWLRWKVDRHCTCICYTCEIICSCSRRGTREVGRCIKALITVWYPTAVEIQQLEIQSLQGVRLVTGSVGYSIGPPPALLQPTKSIDKHMPVTTMFT